MNKILEDINKCVDSCTHFVHYDIAVIASKIFKNMYRYLGSSQWEYYDIQTKTWVKDFKANRFKNDIDYVIGDIFIHRALYWYELSKNYNDIHDEMRAKFMYEKMLRASYIIKNMKYISIVIKEAKGFFDIHNG